jgi:hypothetical protein
VPQTSEGFWIREPSAIRVVIIGAEFLVRREKIEVARHHSTCELSPVPMRLAHRPHTRAFCGHPRRMLQTWDSLAEWPTQTRRVGAKDFLEPAKIEDEGIFAAKSEPAL